MIDIGALRAKLEPFATMDFQGRLRGLNEVLDAIPALLDELERLRAEIEPLEQDIDRHITIASDAMTELERLRAALAAPPTEEQVERAARAICHYDYPSDFNSCCSEPMGEKRCQRHARAALSARGKP